MDYAKKFPDKVLRGHTLLWPSNPKNDLEWLLVHANGTKVDREEAIKRLRNHIQTIVTRYKGQFQYWDVLNEAVDPNALDGIRAGVWKDIIGPQYIEIAFDAARKADPNAKLFYNDFNEWKPKMLIVELVDNHSYFTDNLEIVTKVKHLRHHIEKYNYSEIYKDDINTIFISDDIIQ